MNILKYPLSNISETSFFQQATDLRMLKKIFAIQMMYSALAEKADKKLTVYADAAYHIYYISLIDIL